VAIGACIVTTGKNAMWKRTFGTSVTAMSTFSIGTGTATPAVTDTALQTGLVGWATGGLTYKTFLAGYPTYDTVNRIVTWRGQVISTEANGNTITEIGEFNTDGSPIMLSRSVFTGIAKNSSTQIIFEIKHTIS
jgi:hypothetical protein